VLRRYELVLGFLFATPFWLLVFALASNESITEHLKDPNTTIALAAAVTAALTYRLFANARDQLIHNRKVERAYVKISHPSPGIDQLDSSGLFWLTITIKNYGRTPARVTDVVLKPVVVLHGDPLPTVPDYTGQHQGQKPQAFLVTEDEFRVSRFYQIAQDEMSKVKGLLSDLYIIGFVDYVDQFNQVHRGGYARQYQPMLDLKARYKTNEEFDQRNNLTVVTQEGYNYDEVQ
jgi:hypothetical protein